MMISMPHFLISCNCKRLVCTCRVTTGARQPTCLSVSRSVAGVSLYLWSTRPTWWTYAKKPLVSWRFTRPTKSTTGPWMMSSSLPTLLAWQVRGHERDEVTPYVGLDEYPSVHAAVSVYCVHPPQMCRCTCATKKRMVTSPSQCAPTPPCRMRWRASYILSLSSWVSEDECPKGLHNRI